MRKIFVGLKINSTIKSFNKKINIGKTKDINKKFVINFYTVYKLKKKP